MTIDGRFGAADREVFAERVRQRIELLARNPRDVSMAAIGKPDLVRDIYRLKRMPTAPVMQALAAQLETTTDWLLGRVATPVQPVSEVGFADLAELPRAGSGERLPVLGTAYCDDLAVEGEDGAPLEVERVLLETDHVIRLVERPPALWNAQDAYAIYLHGSSMEPRFEQGDMAFVDPRRPPSPGSYVVAQLNDGESTEIITVLVKRLVRATSAYVELEQFNPPAKFRVPRRQVTRLHRILSNNELYGA